MVRRWDRDWEGHKADIFEKLCKDKGKKKAQEFIDYYSKKYDPYKRAFLDWRCAVELFKDYKRVGHNKIAWYGVVGEGGSGKTEWVKNAAYFLDSEFTPDTTLTDSLEKFMQILKTFKKKKSMRAATLDEPDVTIAPNSHEARVSRPVFGKARQQQLFLFFCATEMSDIPNFIYKRLNRIIFCIGRGNQQGHALLFKDKPGKKKYYLGRLKKDYMEKLSYSVFFNYQKKAKAFNTYKGTPFTLEQEAKYEDNKQKDYIDTLEKACKQLGKKKINTRDKVLENQEKRFKKYLEEGFTQAKIGKFEGLTQQRVQQLLAEFNSNSN